MMLPNSKIALCVIMGVLVPIIYIVFEMIRSKGVSEDAPFYKFFRLLKIPFIDFETGRK